ncbi:hypothetical protein DFR70_107127 [Nocardia tenerifensis]|uniref:Peptidase MA superfamily protein n=1 Tax=Nocardia tenerifensis TaxID=228006 RepID=A0A318JWT4_9NOCA|nr:hypothetical protein [Nocardia tenerifensis]PXX62260.1 hypothetical protein DFR70_107127 [Nocardia tenerifensis]
MNGVRRLRAWWSARRRFEFCLTVAMVIALTGVCGALVLLPNSTSTKPHAAQASTEAVGQAAAADPRLAEVRRSVEPFGPILTRQVATGDGQRSLVVGHPAQRAEIDVLERELAAATAAVTEVWGGDWAQATTVVVASSPAEFAGLVHSTTLSSEVAAASVADPFAPGARPTGQRIVFSPDAGRRLDPDGLRTLLRHELTHIATRAATRDGAPLWMLEGFADYTAHRGQGHRFADIAPTLLTQVRSHAVPGDLPADQDFAGRDAAATYEQAWSVCAYIAERYGQPRLVELYRQIAAAQQTPATEDQILRSVLGTGRDDFVAEWRAWLSAQAT